MRKPIVRLILAACTLIMPPLHAKEFLVKDGESRGVIVIAEQPAPLVARIPYGIAAYPSRVFPDGRTNTVQYVAEEFQRVVGEISGARLPIQTDAEPLPKKCLPIFIGASRHAAARGLTPQGLAPEAYRLRCAPDHAAIIGEVSAEGVDRGTIFGAYDFLERVAGARWYFPGEIGTVIPKARTIPLPRLDEAVAPAYDLRVDGGIGGKYGWHEWIPALRHGGTSRVAVNHTMHTWGRFSQTHPEYFAIQYDGKRKINEQCVGAFNHVCYSQPAVLRQEIENEENWFREKKSVWESSTCPNEVYSYFCPNDVMTAHGVCHCRECLRAWVPEEASGQFSRLVFSYAVQLARELDRRWPGRRLVTAAYECYELAPEGIEIPKNLDVMLCQVRGPQMQVQPAIWTQEQRRIERWSERLGRDRERLTVWQYFVYPNMFYDGVPMLPVHTLARWLRENRARVGGMFNNGFSVRCSPGHEMNLFLVWMWHRLMWNPDADVDALTDDFCRNLFGPAAKPMRAFFGIEIDRWEKTPPGEPSRGAYVFERSIHRDIFPPEVVARLKGLLEEARKATAEGSAERKRVDWYARIHEKFFEENRLFNQWYGKHAEVEIGKMAPGKEKWWADQPSHPLVEMQYGKAPGAATELRFGHDGQSLRVRAEMVDTNLAALVTKATGARNPAVREDDRLELRFDFEDRPYYHYVAVNANGAWYTGIQGSWMPMRGIHRKGLEMEWKVKEEPTAQVTKGTDRWTLDLALPMAWFEAYGIDQDAYRKRGVRMQVCRFKKTPPADQTVLCPQLEWETIWEDSPTRFGVAWFAP